MVDDNSFSRACVVSALYITSFQVSAPVVDCFRVSWNGLSRSVQLQKKKKQGKKKKQKQHVGTYCIGAVLLRSWLSVLTSYIPGVPSRKYLILSHKSWKSNIKINIVTLLKIFFYDKFNFSFHFNSSSRFVFSFVSFRSFFPSSIEIVTR